jgi:hypothetical protein
METSTFYGSKHVVSSPKSTVVPTIVWLVNIPGSLAPWKFGQHLIEENKKLPVSAVETW